MATVLQRRKFNFFDLKDEVDGGKLADAVKDTKIMCVGSGRGIVYLGDANGWLHCVNRSFNFSSFAAHNSAVTLVKAFDHTNRIITAAAALSDGLPEIKIWAADRPNNSGEPLRYRTIHPDPRPNHLSQRSHKPPHLTALAVHSNMLLMALGFSDGSIMLYRGEISRDRGSKCRVVVTISTGEITNLHLKENSKIVQLFATTKNRLYSIDCTNRDKETTVELDTVGCEKGCATLTDGESSYHMGGSDKMQLIYRYTNDLRGSCYVFEGVKKYLSWYKGHLIIAAKDKGQEETRNDAMNLTIYDPVLNLVALNCNIKGLIGVAGEWGGLYLITSRPAIVHISEKDLQSKMEILFRKNQFDIAYSLAKMQRCSKEEIAEILRQYGDWLYGNGHLGTAMDQYIKTIPHLEPSYIIKKYLDTQHIHHLTTYLQALHKDGAATADHTSLMLNCYTRLRDTEQLDEFIGSQGGTLDCDVELGVKVCRGAGYYDHALALADKHGLHHHYLAILVHDKKDYIKALSYIAKLDFYSAKENILNYGTILLNHAPEEMTRILISLCTDYKPSEKPLISDGSLDSYLTPDEVICGDPEDFEYLLVGHSEPTIKLLEHLVNVANKSLTPRLYNTLLGEYLHQYSLDPESQLDSVYGEKALKLLESGKDGTFDKDHALLLCDKYKFHSGKLVLWEYAKMYEQLMEHHAESGDFHSVIKVCNKYGENNPKLWVCALKLITSDKSLKPPDAEHLTKILEEIERYTSYRENKMENQFQTEDNGEESSVEFENLLSPLEIVDLLTSSPHITLGQVRSFLSRVVSQHSATIDSEVDLAEQFSKEMSTLEENIDNITTGATEFTGTKCNICNNNLELPTVHFLCYHSFHQHCFDSYSENEDECPVCLPEVRKIKEEMMEQIKNKQPEAFQKKIEGTNDVFSVVADYLGSGIFTHCDSLVAMYPNLNTTKENIPKIEVSSSQSNPSQAVSEARIREHEHKWKVQNEDQIPQTEGRLRALERSNYNFGSDGEGRLRLGERQGQGILKVESESRMRSFDRKPPDTFNNISEGKLRSSFQSNVIPNQSEGKVGKSIASNISIPSSEARLRVGDVFSKKPSSLHDHITPTPSPNRNSPESRSPSQSISGAISNISKQNVDSSDNPFGSPASEGHDVEDDFQTEAGLSENPFGDDYDKSLNPFGDEESPEHKARASSNPFGDDEELDPSNPFR